MRVLCRPVRVQPGSPARLGMQSQPDSTADRDRVLLANDLHNYITVTKQVGIPIRSQRHPIGPTFPHQTTTVKE
jgi:hypothetical protein